MSSETKDYGTLLTTTISEYMTTIRDTISKANLPYYILNGKKKVQEGQERVEIPLRITKSTSGGWYSGAELLSTAPSDPLTKAFYPWCQMHYTMLLTGIEKFKNSGKGRALDFAQAISDDCTDSMIEDINTSFFAAQAAKAPNSLQVLVAHDPTSASGGPNGDGLVGGIDQSAVTSWRNKVMGYDSAVMTWVWDMDGTAAPTGHMKMEYLYENCSKGGGDRGKRSPDLIICNQFTYRSYLLGLAKQKVFYTDDKIASAGFENVKFNNAILHWDESVASQHTAAGDLTALAYFLNTEYMHWVVGAGKDLTQTPWVRPGNQDAELCQLLLYCALGVSNRRKQGLLDDSTTVSSNVL
jgi:hypothetical protein